MCLIFFFKFDENTTLNKGRSYTFSEHRKFPADYRPKNSLEIAVEHMIRVIHWFIRGKVVQCQ